MTESKSSKFRQSGWREKATNIIHEFYGNDEPPQDGSFVKLWDNEVVTTTTTTPTLQVEEPILEVPLCSQES